MTNPNRGKVTSSSIRKPKIRHKWLRLTEATNALDYLEQTHRFIHETEAIVFAWKWVVIALHGALYGFAVCVCQGSASRSVVWKNKRGKDRLISFDKALELCRASNRQWLGSRSLDLSDRQAESIRILHHEFRNNFEHYIPMGWSIEIHVMPRIAVDVFDAIHFLLFQTGALIHLNQSQMRRARSVISQSKRILKRSALYQEIEFLKSAGSTPHSTR